MQKRGGSAGYVNQSPLTSLRSPVQRHRPIHRMLHRRPHPSRLQQVRLQPEIPLGRSVGVINQHEPRVMLQPLSLQNHCLLILPQKLLRKDPENPDRQKQIPRRHKINPAKVPSHRRNRRTARKPQLPAPNLLGPHVGQNKVDSRSYRLAGIPLQQPVRRTVRARRMRTHPKPIRNRLKLLLLLVNAVPAAPVPRLMHKRPMRRVHQADNPLIDMRRQLASKMREPILLAENAQLGSRRGARCQVLCRGGACPSLRSIALIKLEGARRDRPTRHHVNPNVSVALFAGIMPGKYALDFELVLASQGGNLNTLPTASVKPPTVITALNGRPVKPPMRKRNAAMRTRIPHSKRLSLRSPSQHKRDLQQRRRGQPPPGNLAAPNRRIPKIPKKAEIAFGADFSRRRIAGVQDRSNRFAHR